MRRKRGRPAIKNSVKIATSQELTIKRKLAELGLILKVNWVSCKGGRVLTAHWMVSIDDSEDGRRVLDYWPGTGRWWSAELGLKGHTTLEDLPPLAERLASKVSMQESGW